MLLHTSKVCPFNFMLHIGWKVRTSVVRSQFPGRLFSWSDKSKKLSRHFLLHFWIDIGSYDHHAKYQGVFQDLLENTFFIRVPPLDKENLNEFKGKVFYRRSGNTPWDILRGGHRNPYQLENAIKSRGTVFCLYHLG